MRFFIPANWKVLILEDSEERIAWFKERLPNAMYAKTSVEAALLLAKHKFNVAFLDHDLHWMHQSTIKIFKGTGREVARFMQTIKFKGLVVIHSRNPLGADMMCEYLPQARLAPFGEFELECNQHEAGARAI